MTGAPSASKPLNTTGPASSTHAKAAIIGDFPAPFGSTTCARRHRNRPAASMAYHHATKRACDTVQAHRCPACAPSGCDRVHSPQART